MLKSWAALVLACVLCSSAAGGPISVYFIAGQSNASGFAPTEGLPPHLANQPDIIYRGTSGPMVNGLQATGTTFGPELSFARSMKDTTLEPVAVVKVAWGSTSLAVDWHPNGGKRYTQFIARMDSTLNALASWGYTPTVRGGVWVQGEEDALYEAMAQAYGANLAALLHSLRARWGAELPIAVARINAPYRLYRDDVRDAQWSAVGEWTTIWDTDDLPLMDPVHYSQSGEIALGNRMAAGLLRMRYEARLLPAQTRAVPEPPAWPLLLLAAVAIMAAGSRRRR